MSQLQPAGLLGWLVSSFFPKKLEVQVEANPLADGSVELNPVYLIDGQQVDPGLIITTLSSQRVLGYSVNVNDAVLSVRRQGITKLTKRKAADYLGELRQKGVSIRTKGKKPIEVNRVKPELTLTLNPDDSLDIRSELATDKGVIVEKPVDIDQLRRDDGWYVANGDLLHAESTNTPLDNMLLVGETSHRLTGDSVPGLLQRLEVFKDKIGHIEKNDALQNLDVYGKDREHRAKVDGDQDSIHISPSLTFLGKDRHSHELTPEELADLEGKGGGYKRIPEGWIGVAPKHLEEYRHACEELRSRLGDLDHIEGTKIPNTLLTLVTKDAFQSPWAVYFSEAVKNSHRIVDTPADVQFKLNVVDSDGRSLLELDPIYNHERFRLTHADNLGAVTNGEEWVRRRDAWIKVDEDKYKRIKAAIDILGLEPGTTGFSFPASQREKVVEIFSLLGSIEHSQSYAAFLTQLADFEKIEEVDLPTSVRPGISFRPYQKHGYNWLAFLHRYGLNGVLADDMGLGKTLQTLAIIQRAKERDAGKLPSLVICPTSVVHNWEAEAQRFFKDCPVILYTGTNRAKKLRLIKDFLKLKQYGLSSPLVVTSYDIARRDHEELNRIPWVYVVVDEGHNIKNPDAHRTKAIKTINGHHKLALTGTPIQNNLEELWSLFDFAMPGYLGARKVFREKYGRNGQVDWTAVRHGPDNLKHRIHPFIMRRLKENVAKDLPPKTIVDQKIELSPLQVALYKKVLEGAEYKKLLQEVESKGVQRAQPYILAAYTQLRGVCNHPALVKEHYHQDSLKYADSGKLECLKELIEEIIDGEHRALLFCQSTQMLDIIEDFFARWKVVFLRLDGNTPSNRRQGLVDEFNGNHTIHCFLISTKAGGTGLNLTGADTVIFYDHDWNPANDNQAQDRAYRIGQTKPVTVYKLISKGTIEEKIIERQALKQTLADEIIGVDKEGFKDLTKDDLLALFKLDEPSDE